MPIVVGGFIAIVLVLAVLATAAIILVFVAVPVIVIVLLIEFVVAPELGRRIAALLYFLLGMTFVVVLPYGLHEGAIAHHASISQQQDFIGYSIISVLFGVVLILFAAISFEDTRKSG